MTRFKWNDRNNGRLINRYLDTICRDYPAIAKDVVKHGIGDLDSWFSGEPTDADGCTVANATCGCLVGTSALVAVSRYKKAAEKAVKMVEANDNTDDAALVLYNLLVVKTGRDISKYTVPTYSSSVDMTYWEDYYDTKPRFDPLLVLIYKAGLAASDETEIGAFDYNAGDYSTAKELREKQVIDRIEGRIRRNLNIPYPKQRKNASQTRV